MVLGAPSTSALASARPRPGTALRTSLITPILFAPISFRMTSKEVFSSAAAGAAPAPAAGAATAATGAAALTPHFSSSCFTRPAISRTVRPLSCSTIAFVSAILFSSHAPPSEASEELRPAAAEPDVVFGCSLGQSRRREIFVSRPFRQRVFLLWLILLRVPLQLRELLLPRKLPQLRVPQALPLSSLRLRAPLPRPSR